MLCSAPLVSAACVEAVAFRQVQFWGTHTCRYYLAKNSLCVLLQPKQFSLQEQSQLWTGVRCTLQTTVACHIDLLKPMFT